MSESAAFQTTEVHIMNQDDTSVVDWPEVHTESELRLAISENKRLQHAMTDDRFQELRLQALSVPKIHRHECLVVVSANDILGLIVRAGGLVEVSYD